MPTFPRGLKAIPRLATPPRFPEGMESWGQSGKGQFRSTQSMGREWTEVYPLLDGSLATVRALIASINQSLREKVIWDVQHPYWHVNKGVGGGTSGVVITDTYTRADNASSLGSTETGQLYTVHQGTVGVLGGEAYFPSNSDGDVVTLESGRRDDDARIDIKSSAWTTIWGGLVIRGIDPTNFLLVQAEAGTMFLYKCDNGVFTQLQGNAQSLVNDTQYTLRAVYEDESITIFRDETELFTYALVGADLVKFGAAGATRIGFRMSRSGAGTLRYDNLSFVGLGFIAPLVNGSNQTGSNLIVDGGSTSITDWLRHGDIIKVAGQPVVYDVTGDVSTDGAGQATIPIHPPIFVGRSPADNAIVTIDPTAIFFKAVIVEVPDFPSMDVTRHIDPGLTLTWREQPQ